MMTAGNKNSILSLNDFLGFRNDLMNKFSLYVHMHDACTGQTFTFDSRLPDEAANWISEYFAGRGQNVVFYSDGTGFSLS